MSSGGMVGRAYLWRGRPVVVVVQWRNTAVPDLAVAIDGAAGKNTPRNVLVRDDTGRLLVIPSRPLRRPP
jgi:hypothetical protein